MNPVATIPSHCSWFESTNTTLRTSDGKEVPIIHFNHQTDSAEENGDTSVIKSKVVF